MSNNFKHINPKRAVELLKYNPKTGDFFHRHPGRGKQLNKPAGTKLKNGYVVLKIDGEHVFAHRVAIAYMTGKSPTHAYDHKDRNRSNNSMSNLRKATPTQNSHNVGVISSNKSGYRGVSLLPDGRFRARIMIDGKYVSLGNFTDAYDAHLVYDGAAKATHGEFYCPPK